MYEMDHQFFLSLDHHYNGKKPAKSLKHKSSAKYKERGHRTTNTQKTRLSCRKCLFHLLTTIQQRFSSGNTGEKIPPEDAL
jgi:hypothetical protein